VITTFFSEKGGHLTPFNEVKFAYANNTNLPISSCVIKLVKFAKRKIKKNPFPYCKENTK
jgi:hypothetical protein